MNLLALIKQVPGSNNVSIDPETGTLKRDGTKGKLNPDDFFALVTAISLKERYGGLVTALTMGPPQAEEIMLEAAAMGADEVVVACDRAFAGADVYATAYTLYGAIRKLGTFDLVVCGKQTTDGSTGQIGPEVAELLGVPHLTNVTDIAEIKENKAIVTANLDHEALTASVNLPCLFSIETGANTPRRATKEQREKAAAKKAVRILSLSDLEDSDAAHYGLTASPTQVEGIFEPDKPATNPVAKGGAELADSMYALLKEWRMA